MDNLIWKGNKMNDGGQILGDEDKPKSTKSTIRFSDVPYEKSETFCVNMRNIIDGIVPEDVGFIMLFMADDGRCHIMDNKPYDLVATLRKFADKIEEVQKAKGN